MAIIKTCFLLLISSFCVLLTGSIRWEVEDCVTSAFLKLTFSPGEDLKASEPSIVSHGPDVSFSGNEAGRVPGGGLIWKLMPGQRGKGQPGGRANGMGEGLVRVQAKGNYPQEVFLAPAFPCAIEVVSLPRRPSSPPRRPRSGKYGVAPPLQYQDAMNQPTKANQGGEKAEEESDGEESDQVDEGKVVLRKEEDDRDTEDKSSEGETSEGSGTEDEEEKPLHKEQSSKAPGSTPRGQGGARRPRVVQPAVHLEDRDRGHAGAEDEEDEEEEDTPEQGLVFLKSACLAVDPALKMRSFTALRAPCWKVQGRGQVALAGMGGLRRHRVPADRLKGVTEGHVVAWTAGMTVDVRRDKGGGAGRGRKASSGRKPPTWVFRGPGEVWVQPTSPKRFLNFVAPPQGGGSVPAPRAAPPSPAPDLVRTKGPRKDRNRLAGKRRGPVAWLKQGIARVLTMTMVFILITVAQQILQALLLGGLDGVKQVPGQLKAMARSLLHFIRTLWKVFQAAAADESWRIRGYQT